MSSLLSVLHNALPVATPLLIAALGGLLTELTGILNIGLEGLMLTGAFFGFLVAGMTGSVALGAAAGMGAAGLLALLFAYACLKLRANIFISGIAINLLAASLTSILATRFFGRKGIYRTEALPSLFKTAAADWTGPVGRILLDQSLFVYAGWLLALLVSVALYRTSFGLRLRAAGHDPRTLKALGLRPTRYRFAAIMLCGLACGLAGAYLSLNLEAFVPNITAGRGWIALVIIFLGYRRPGGIVIASLVFGLAESLSNFSQGFLDLPSQVILAFPYLISAAALVVYSIWEYHRHFVSRFRLPPR